MVGVSLSGAAGRVFAGPWSAQPLIGVSGEYASNPQLIASRARSETHAALIIDCPVNYDLDTVHFAVVPRVRYGGATGYSSVASNYYHLDASAQFSDEFGSLTFTGTQYLDSSLLYAGELSNGIGVRRNTSTADVNWRRSISERLQFQFDANTARTRYAQTVSANLVDYRYSTLAPAFAYGVNERDTLRFLGSVSRYKSLNGLTDSDSANIQLGLDHHLNELWKLSTSAGYSKSTNRYHYFFAPLEYTQKGTVYSANLTRQGEVLTMTASASRALAPTGSAFLSRQDTVNAFANYSYSDRWTFGASATWQNVADPVITGGSAHRRFYNAYLSATWHWTEQWTLGLQVSKVGQQFAPQLGRPLVSPTSNGVRLDISRQFYRTNQ